MSRLNKKVICFADEFGTAGDDGFGFGLVFIMAQDCAHADRVFTSLLPASANEVHASKWHNDVLQTLMENYKPTIEEKVLLLNIVGQGHAGERPEVYAKTLIEAVKNGLRKFARMHHIPKIGNVDLIMDASGLGTHALCKQHLLHAQTGDGRFQAVRNIATIDSTACRMLQVADVVAYSRKWLASSNAATLQVKYGITLD